MRLEISDLREILNRMLDDLASEGSENIQISSDYYWNIPSESIYDLSGSPESLDIGQLSDDWDELKRLQSNKIGLISHHFIWASSLVRAIGEQLMISTAGSETPANDL